MHTRQRPFRKLLGAAALLIGGSIGTANAGLIIEIDFDLGTPGADVTAIGVNLSPNLNVASALYTDGAGNFVQINASSGAPDNGVLIDTNFQISIVDGAEALIRIFEDDYNLGSGTVAAVSHVTPTTVGPATTTLQTFVNGQLVLDTGPLVPGSEQNSVLVSLADPSNIEHLVRISNTSGQVSSTTFDTVTRVPEPSIAALLGLGLLGFAAVRRRQLNG